MVRVHTREKFSRAQEQLHRSKSKGGAVCGGTSRPAAPSAHSGSVSIVKRAVAPTDMSSLAPCHRTDVLSGAAVHDGQWVRSGPNISTDGHWAPACARAVAWQWAPHACRLPDDRELLRRVCVPGRTLLFVGDSLGRIAFDSLGFGLQRAGVTCRIWGPQGETSFPPPWAPPDRAWLATRVTEMRCTDVCNETRFGYAHNDFLCVSCAEEHRSFENERPQFSLSRLRLAEMSQWLVGEDVTIVANSGLWWTAWLPPWYNHSHNHETFVEDEYRVNVREALAFFLATPAMPVPRLLLRLDYPGHDHCGLASQPYHGPFQRPSAVSSWFNWHRMITYNHLAAAECSKHASCDLLDVSHLASLRADAHLRPAADAFGPMDCAHFCSFGEPSASSLQLLATMLHPRRHHGLRGAPHAALSTPRTSFFRERA